MIPHVQNDEVQQKEQAPAPLSEHATLRPNSVGLAGVVFQSITTMAPASAITFSLAAAVPYAGAALPLAVFIALIICTMIALNFGSLARHLPSAGSCFTYVSYGLGPRAGWITGWLLGLTLIIPLQLLVLGLVASFLAEYYLHLSLAWTLWAMIFALIIVSLTCFGIRISVRITIVLGMLEIVVFLCLAISLIFTAGASNTLAPFQPVFSAETGWGGWQGILHGMIFAFLAFAGFEAAAPLAEEVQRPRRAIPRALLLSTISVGLFYVFCSYAGVVGWGMASMATYSTTSNPWLLMANRVWGPFGCVVLLAILNSTLVNSVAVLNAAGRLLYAMGRTRTLPSQFAHINSRFRTPDVAIIFSMIVGGSITFLFGSLYDPIPAFALLGTIITILVLIVYGITCLAVPFFYWHEHRREFSIVRHVLLPGIPIIVLLFTLYAQFVSAPPSPINLAGPFSLLWLLLGLLIVTLLRRRAPHVLDQTHKIYLEGELANRKSAWK